MIEVKNLSKKFIKKISSKESKEFLADNDITFTAYDGEVLGILGPNGAGKTTLLRMISGIMTPTSGEVIVDEKKYVDSEIEIKKMIAFMSGNTKLYKDISPLELLTMCGEYYDVDKNVLEIKIREILDRFDMKGFANQKIGTLSTGQYQRVAIARCLIHSPKYYILDEATSGLDVISSKVILDFINDEKKNGTCFLYSTHYMEEAENICDKLVLINKGKVIAYGTPLEILEKTNTKNIRDAFFALIGGCNE